MASIRTLSAQGNYGSPSAMVGLLPAAAIRTAKLWNLSNGRLRRTLSGHLRPIYSLAFSPQGEYPASGSNIGEIKL